MHIKLPLSETSFIWNLAFVYGITVYQIYYSTGNISECAVNIWHALSEKWNKIYKQKMLNHTSTSSMPLLLKKNVIKCQPNVLTRLKIWSQTPARIEINLQYSTKSWKFNFFRLRFFFALRQKPILFRPILDSKKLFLLTDSIVVSEGISQVTACSLEKTWSMIKLNTYVSYEKTVVDRRGARCCFTSLRNVLSAGCRPLD